MDKISIEEKLRFIGIGITGGEGATPGKEDWIDLEKTIYEASFESPESSRVFMLLCSWVKIHGEYVIIEKLIKLQKQKKSVWLVALALYALNEGFHKWSRLIEKVDGEHSLSSIAVAKQAIDYRGGETYFTDYGFLISKGSLRIRESDIRSPEELIKLNGQYKNRYLFGANIRADIIHAIQIGLTTPYKIAKTVGCSYHPAHRIFKEYNLARSAG